MNEPAVLTLYNLSKRYAGFEAVSGLSFSVGAGTITALIGPNGAGKSTTFNVISGLERPSFGSVVFEGTDITAFPVYDRCHLGIGRTFQAPKVFDHLTVSENIMVGLHGRSRSGLVRAGARLPGFKAEERRIHEDAAHWLAFAGLEYLANRSAGALSFGEQRALEFARAIAAKPKLLLLDEPTSGLTPSETEVFAAKLKAVVRDGVTVLIVEHDLPFITSIADKVVVLAHGKKIYDGSVVGMRENEGVIDAYVGRPRNRDARN